MRLRLGSIRRLIREALSQQVGSPGRYPSNGDPVNVHDVSRLNRPLGRKDLDEVDLDPANNPGRPADAYEYVGMHPSPSAAMSHPYADGSGPQGGAAPGTSSASGDSLEAVATGEPEPTVDG